MCRYFLIVALVAAALAPTLAEGDTYKLTSGQEINGTMLPSSANDLGVQIRVGEDQYQRVSWANLSQETLKELVKNKKLEPFVSPFIEITQAEKIKRTAVHIKPPQRLARPASQSLLAAMFSSGVGLVILLVLYAANIYAGYEIAIFRARPPLVVAGLAAIPFLGFVVPIAFLSMKTRTKPVEEPVEVVAETASETAGASATAQPDDANPMQAAGAQHPTGLRLAHTDGDGAAGGIPATQTFQRGQFTFNRRFFETKFANFFGVARRDADRDMRLVIKSSRGEYTGQRITRIAANDLHLQIQRGAATEEVMIPFQEVQEILLKHKDAQ